MQKNENIVSGIIRFYIPSIVSFVLGLVSAIVLTRVFAPETYGLLTIFNNTSTLLLAISYLGLDSAYIRFYNEPPKGVTSKDLCYSLLSICSTFLIAFGAIITLFFNEPFSERILGITSRLICSLLFLNVFAQLIIRFFLITYRMEMNTKRFSIVTILSQIATKFCVVIAAVLSSKIDIVMVFNTLGILLIALFLLGVYSNNIIPKKKKLIIDHEVIRYGVLEAPSPIIIQFNLFLVQQLIKHRFGMEAVGIYSSANYFLTIFGVLQSGFATYWSAYVYGKYKTNQETIKKAHNYLLIAVIFVYGLMILSRDLVYLLIGKEFHESKSFYALVLFYPVMLLLTETTGCGIHIAKKNHISLIINFCSVCFNVICALLLSPFLGLKGIAFSYGVSGLLYYSISSFFGQKFYKTIPTLGRSICGLGILVAMFTISYFFSGFTFYTGIIISILVGIVMFRKELFDVYVLLNRRMKALWKR